MTTFTSEDRMRCEPKLESHADKWTNTTDHWWTLEGRAISPFFTSYSDALQWKREYDTQWDNWKAIK